MTRLLFIVSVLLMATKLGWSAEYKMDEHTRGSERPISSYKIAEIASLAERLQLNPAAASEYIERIKSQVADESPEFASHTYRVVGDNLAQKGEAYFAAEAYVHALSLDPDDKGQLKEMLIVKGVKVFTLEAIEAVLLDKISKRGVNTPRRSRSPSSGYASTGEAGAGMEDELNILS